MSILKIKVINLKKKQLKVLRFVFFFLSKTSKVSIFIFKLQLTMSLPTCLGLYWFWP